MDSATPTSWQYEVAFHSVEILPPSLTSEPVPPFFCGVRKTKTWGTVLRLRLLWVELWPFESDVATRNPIFDSGRQKNLVHGSARTMMQYQFGYKSQLTVEWWVFFFLSKLGYQTLPETHGPFVYGHRQQAESLIPRHCQQTLHDCYAMISLLGFISSLS